MHAILYTWSINKFHLADQINRAGNTLLTDLPAIIYPFQGRLTQSYINPALSTALHPCIGHIREYFPPGAFKKGATEDKPTLTKTPSKNNLERKAICFSLTANESLVLSCLQEFLCCEPWLRCTLTVSTAFLREKHLFTRSSVPSSFRLRLHLQLTWFSNAYLI